MRRPAHRLDPPHLHRRLGVRGVRRREPAVLSATAVSLLQRRLGLSDDELCAVLDADPLTLIAGELEHRPELPILLTLTQEAADNVGEDLLARWLRTTGPAGRPLDHLLRRDFARFEDALAALAEKDGFAIRIRKASPPSAPG